MNSGSSGLWVSLSSKLHGEPEPGTGRLETQPYGSYLGEPGPSFLEGGRNVRGAVWICEEKTLLFGSSGVAGQCGFLLGRDVRLPAVTLPPPCTPTHTKAAKTVGTL